MYWDENSIKERAFWKLRTKIGKTHILFEKESPLKTHIGVILNGQISKSSNL